MRSRRCLQGQPVANAGEARASSHPTELGYSASSLAASRIGAGKDAKELRKPLYCAGCPHNVSTRVPAGSRAVAGIGCHYMAQWMDRDTYTPTQMGGEGANWIGQAPFTDEGHIFVNLGDGTYFHSGILAIRAAVSAGVNVTYKLLFNDAVAMTGGQPVDGRLSVADVVAQMRAEGGCRGPGGQRRAASPPRAGGAPFRRALNSTPCSANCAQRRAARC